MAKVMRKVRTGSVVRTKQDKTAVVEMVWKQRHRLYHKQVRRVTRFHVHDPESQCQLGDVVRIQETRPISKTKHWRLLEIVQRRPVAGVRPIELESDVAPAFATEDEMADELQKQPGDDQVPAIDEAEDAAEDDGPEGEIAGDEENQ